MNLVTTFLQHGSIPIACNRSLLNSLFKHKTSGAPVRSMNILNTKITTVSECLGKDVTRGEVSQALKQGFSRALFDRWFQGSLSSSELARCTSTSV